MLTKREFAEMIVEDFCKEENIKREDAHTHICASSRLAVALEYLGELTPFEKEYSSTRGGTEYRKIVLDSDGKFDTLHILSTRELLNLLPD